jgi:hypothetical protein
MKSAQNTIELLGLDQFSLWPRECVTGLLQFDLEDIIAEESHTDAKTGLTQRKAFRLNPPSSQNFNPNLRIKIFWKWGKWPVWLGGGEKFFDYSFQDIA